MSLGEELNERVKEIFSQQWKLRSPAAVPEAEDLPLANVAAQLDPATVLYSDISGSTTLVNTQKWTFAAEVYKSFLFCAARVIGAEGGTVTAYDGDRIMAVFIGDTPNTSAARTALKINYCAKNIVNPLSRSSTLIRPMKSVTSPASTRVRYTPHAPESEARTISCGWDALRTTPQN